MSRGDTDPQLIPEIGQNQTDSVIGIGMLKSTTKLATGIGMSRTTTMFQTLIQSTHTSQLIPEIMPSLSESETTMTSGKKFPLRNNGNPSSSTEYKALR